MLGRYSMYSYLLLFIRFVVVEPRPVARHLRVPGHVICLAGQNLQYTPPSHSLLQNFPGKIFFCSSKIYLFL